MTLNNSMSITPSPPGQAKGAKFEHGSVLGGKTRGARVSSQWKSTVREDMALHRDLKRRRLPLLDRVQLIESLNEEKISDLFDH
jgi:hypothetical protein